MYHHDDRNYQVALGEAKAHLDQQIQARSASAANVIGKVLGTTLVDRVMPSRKACFLASTETVKSTIEDEPDKHQHTIHISARGHDGFTEPLHKHALGQAATRVGIPESFVNRMLERPYGGELLADTMNKVYREEPSQNFLVRSSGTQVRGVLSDTYRRMDSRPILEAFAETVQGLGAVPIEGIGGDLRFSVKALIPVTHVVGKKAGNEEVFAFGASLSNSDFGCGATSLQFFLWRIWCSNTATREDSLRKVHLGKRLSEDITYSQDTYAADTRTMSLAIRDHVKAVLAPPRIKEALAQIETALDTAIEPKKFFERGGQLEKLKLNRTEIEQTREVFNNGDVTVLPRGTSVARMSQAVAWLAQSATPERRLELERIAGVIMEKVA